MSVNRVILVGRLGRDPETRYTQAGDAVCSFSVATDESWKNKQTGLREQKTEWHNIVLYRQLAEIAQQYLTKGKMVYVEGRIQSRKYTGKDGIERTQYEIIGDKMQMLGSRGEQDQQSAAVPPPPTRQNQSPAPVNDLDDDIPF